MIARKKPPNLVFRVIMKTASTLPCEQPRSLIVSAEATEMSPIENAINTMKEKNAELRDAIDVRLAA